MAINDPRDIPGLVAWYSADHAAASAANGVAVPTWTDLSGNGNHAVGSPGPLLRTGVGATGGPAISFENAAGQFYSLPANLMGGATAGEVMVTTKAAPGTWGLWALGSSANETLYPYNVDGYVYEQFGLQSGGRQSFPQAASVTSWRRYNVWSAPGDWSASMDGIVAKTYTGGTVTWDAAPLLGRGRYLGNPDLLYGGYMGAFLLYSRKLTTAERSDLTTWVTAHWSGGTPTASVPSGALTATLPVPTVALSGTYTAPAVPGSLAATLPVPTVALAGSYAAPPSGALAATLPVPSVALAGTFTPPAVPTGVLALSLPVPTTTLAGGYVAPAAEVGSLDLTLPIPTLTLSGAYVGDAPVEIVRNGFGLVLDSSATVDVVAPLDSGSLSSTVPLHIIAATVPVPTLVAGRPS